MVHDMVNLLYNIYSCKILYLEFVSFFKLIHWDQLTGTCKWPWHSEAAELFTEVKYTCRTYAHTMTQRVNTKHESQSSLEELTSWKMDAAVLDWNVSWVFDIENSPRDKPFSCVIKMENKTTESLGAFPLLSLMIISTEVHISEQSCKVNTIFFTPLLKNHKLPPLFYLDHNELFPMHREWNEVIFMIYFFNMFSFLTNLSVLLLFTYIFIQYIELCNVLYQFLVTTLLYPSSVGVTCNI